MHWIYIIRCQDNIIYVGETTRLFRRLLEHIKGIGSCTTKDFKPYQLIGIYKLIKDGLTFKDESISNEILDENKTWALDLENQITLMYMKAMNIKWYDVYGGKYHEGYRPEINPSKDIKLYRPYCKCKIPADINIHNDKKYWRCCKKNTWEGLDDFLENTLNFKSLNCCDYYKEFNNNEEYKCEKYIYNDIKLLKDLLKKSFWLIKIPDKNEKNNNCIICKYYITKSNGICFGKKLLCIDCFINKNNELSLKYKI